MIIKRLMQSIREYKKDSILAPLYVSCEVVLEIIIQFKKEKWLWRIRTRAALSTV